MKTLITGVSGFVGTYLSARLLKEGYEVVGLSRSQPQNTNIEHIICDITDKDSVESALRYVRPSHIYHLASSSFIPSSIENPMNSYSTIVNGTLALYESVRKLGLDSKILYVGSGDSYGDGKQYLFNESDLLRPSNPYAGAKACADIISEQYARTYQMKIIRARPFNHTGPRQSQNFVCSSFAKQIADMEINGDNILYVGNIDIQRDFLDVRDVVNAYHALMSYGTIGEAYNVSAQNAISISDLLDILIQHSNVNSPIIKVDPNKVRRIDAKYRAGENCKLQRDTGWQPTYDLRETMKDLLDYWRTCR